MRKKRLGDVLVDERLIRRDQLHQAERVAERLGSPLISVLVDQGLINEEALVNALSRNLHLEVFDPSLINVDPKALREIPYEEADRYWILPLKILDRGSHRVLRIAMADPLDTQAIENIEFSTDSIVEPLIAHPSHLSEIIRGHYRGIVTKVIPRTSSPPHERRIAKKTSRAIQSDNQRSSRTPFGASIKDSNLRTQPVRQIQKMATLEQKVDALVSILVHKGVITLDEYEEQLEAFIVPLEDKP